LYITENFSYRPSPFLLKSGQLKFYYFPGTRDNTESDMTARWATAEKLLFKDALLHPIHHSGNSCRCAVSHHTIINLFI